MESADKAVVIIITSIAVCVLIGILCFHYLSIQETKLAMENGYIQEVSPTNNRLIWKK